MSNIKSAPSEEAVKQVVELLEMAKKSNEKLPKYWAIGKIIDEGNIAVPKLQAHKKIKKNCTDDTMYMCRQIYKFWPEDMLEGMSVHNMFIITPLMRQLKKLDISDKQYPRLEREVANLVDKYRRGRVPDLIEKVAAIKLKYKTFHLTNRIEVNRGHLINVLSKAQKRIERFQEQIVCSGILADESDKIQQPIVDKLNQLLGMFKPVEESQVAPSGRKTNK